MLVSNSGPDAASRAAIRLLKEWLPGASAVEGSADFDLSSRAEQPQLRSAEIVEGSALRAMKVPDVTRTMVSGFGAFLDGAQRVRVIARDAGVPLVLGTTSAAIRVRLNRRLTSWGQHAPRSEQKLYLPLRYLPALAESLRASPQRKVGGFEVVDTAFPDESGKYPSEHPAVLLERAIRAVDRQRDAMEDALAEEWCADGDVPLTPRELEVLALLAEGASNKVIARRLGISVHTAKFHVASLLDKRDAVGRTDAVAHAARRGVINL